MVADQGRYEFMALCHGSCRTARGSAISVIAEVYPMTACDVTFHLCVSSVEARGHYKAEQRQRPLDSCNMSFELPVSIPVTLMIRLEKR